MLHVAGVEAYQRLGEPWGVVAPLCGQPGPLAVHMVRPIIEQEISPGHFDFVYAPVRLNNLEIALEARPPELPPLFDQMARCTQCAVLEDEHNGGGRGVEFRLARCFWGGRGGSALPPSVSESYFAPRRRARKNWPFIATLYPSTRAPAMKALVAKLRGAA